MDQLSGWVGTPRGITVLTTIGWRPACSCYDCLYRQFPRAKSARQRPGKDDWPIVPCLVLDPFAGAGTTGMVADRLGRDAVLIDIKPEYCEMSYERIVMDAGPMFAQVEIVGS